ncbi:acyl-CoA dehydrogenase [Saccharomonospora marina XMU15]|uniref:Acyl-CoA dehydrogenase n=1 Tax=Saccharomonospora marina XMU15 TaxID=882083 RepID=H5X9D1_9PSEU|nr:acyl-CoA dehydrogenase family protein [Saccharomonospora marina]EHR50296.1 acyl-CoA dehydrogenase [Saccharomonospora marina XMU15]
MRLVATDEHRDLRAMLRQLLDEHCPPSLARQLKQPGREDVPPALWSALADTGILGIAVDADYGGGGGGLYELGLVFSEAGRALCPTPVYDTLLFAVALGRLADTEQRRRYLSALTQGSLKATVAAWNPSDASDLMPTLTARPVAGGWSVSGTLPYVSNADCSDVVLTTARAVADGEPSRLIGLLLDPHHAGLQARPLTTMARDRQARVLLEESYVPDDEALTGVAGRGLTRADLSWVANVAVALQCMEMTGGARAVLERTVDYIAAREQFGRPIGAFQAAQHLVADMHIAVEAATLTAQRAVWWLGKGEPVARYVAIAAMHASEAYKQATLTAHQLHGGMGYVRETDLHLWSERAKVSEVRNGTADVAAGWLGKELGLGRAR